MIPEISASKVAGFIGVHKYQDKYAVFYELLSKDKGIKAQIQDIERTFNRRTLNSVFYDVYREPTIRDCVQTAVKQCETTDNVEAVIKDVADQAKVIMSLRNDSLPEELRNRLAEEVGGMVSKQRGLKNENAILNKYEETENVKVVERNTRTFKKSCGTFNLIGRTDGYVASENRIVDSKERTRFWPNVPIYDEIQLRTYMFMSDAKESELIERFPDGSSRITKFTNDPEKWKSLETAIQANVARIVEATTNPEELKRIVFANTVAMA